MRIITGQYKGRVIKAPKGIRPTEDRVRKAFFDILGDISGLKFLELFAGSGAMGLEALSGGAAKVVFVEKERVCIKLIHENIRIVSSQEALSEVLPADVFFMIPQFKQHGEQFDLIFADPPYYQGMAEKTLQTLAYYDILTTSGYLVIQHFKKDPLSDRQGNLSLFKQSKYGDSILSFYQHSG